MIGPAIPSGILVIKKLRWIPVCVSTKADQWNLDFPTCWAADGIPLVADMPGVTKERLQQRLVTEGVAQLDIPEGMEVVYADMRSTSHRRSLALSNERDTERSVLTARVVRG